MTDKKEKKKKKKKYKRCKYIKCHVLKELLREGIKDIINVKMFGVYN